MTSNVTGRVISYSWPPPLKPAVRRAERANLGGSDMAMPGHYCLCAHFWPTGTEQRFLRRSRKRRPPQRPLPRLSGRLGPRRQPQRHRHSAWSPDGRTGAALSVGSHDRRTGAARSQLQVCRRTSNLPTLTASFTPRAWSRTKIRKTRSSTPSRPSLQPMMSRVKSMSTRSQPSALARQLSQWRRVAEDARRTGRLRRQLRGCRRSG